MAAVNLTSRVKFAFPRGNNRKAYRFLKGRVISSGQEGLDIRPGEGVAAAGTEALDLIFDLVANTPDPQNAIFDVYLTENTDETNSAETPWFATRVSEELPDQGDITVINGGGVNEGEITCDALTEFLTRCHNMAKISPDDRIEVQSQMIKDGFDFVSGDKATIQGAFQLRADGLVRKRKDVVHNAIVSALTDHAPEILETIYSNKTFHDRSLLTAKELVAGIEDLLPVLE